MSEEETKVEAAAETPLNESSATVEAAPKKKGKKWPIVVGIVAVVLIAAGAGFFVWHEQPSFCGAICHVPMDEYLETYEQEPGVAGFDKWGNEVSDTSTMLCVAHKDQAGLTCMACHVPTLEEQMTEGVHWLTGAYEYPLLERDLDMLAAARGLEGEQFCLNESCHNLTRNDLIEATSGMDFNPHVTQHGPVACSNCHKGHRASVFYCTKCHQDVQPPEGWLTMAEADKLNQPKAPEEA